MMARGTKRGPRRRLKTSSGSVRVVVIGVLLAAVTVGGGTAILLTSGNGDSGPPSPTQAQSDEEALPPVTQGRVEGSFEGKGFYGAELTFTPNCATGPCDLSAEGKRTEVLLAQPEGADFGALGMVTKGTPIIYVSKKPKLPVDLAFAFDGQTYRADLRFQQDCSITGFKVPVRMTFEFEVTEAELIDDEWRATELRTTTKVRTGRQVFDQSDTDYPAFVEFKFTCLSQRGTDRGTRELL